MDGRQEELQRKALDAARLKLTDEQRQRHDTLCQLLKDEGIYADAYAIQMARVLHLDEGSLRQKSDLNEIFRKAERDTQENQIRQAALATKQPAQEAPAQSEKLGSGPSPIWTDRDRLVEQQAWANERLRASRTEQDQTDSATPAKQRQHQQDQNHRSEPVSVRMSRLKRLHAMYEQQAGPAAARDIKRDQAQGREQDQGRSDPSISKSESRAEREAKELEHHITKGEMTERRVARQGRLRYETLRQLENDRGASQQPSQPRGPSRSR